MPRPRRNATKSITEEPSNAEIPEDKILIFNSTDLEKMVPAFDPKNAMLSAKRWIHHIELIAKMYGWTEMHSLACATIRLDGVARDWFEMEIDSINTWKNFKDAFLKMYHNEIDEVTWMLKLNARKRLDGETVDDYFNSVVKLARLSKVSEAVTKKYLIRGLDDAVMRMHLSGIKDNLTLVEFLKNMRALDNANFNEKPSSSSVPYSKTKVEKPRDPKDHKTNQYKIKNKSTNYNPDYNRKRLRNRQKFSHTKLNSTRRKCYRCDEPGHIASKCTKNKSYLNVGSVTLMKNSSSENTHNARRCLNCNEIGHFMKNCKLRRDIKVESTKSQTDAIPSFDGINLFHTDKNRYLDTYVITELSHLDTIKCEKVDVDSGFYKSEV